MIRFVAEHVIGLGITEENVKRLMKGQPIRVTFESLGFKGDPREIVIFYGPTEQTIMKDFVDAGFITPETKIHEEP